MYSEELYKEALEHFNEDEEFNIENDFVKEHAEELIYCYVHEKDLVDFDFWTRYEELLGEKLSYQEYVYVDRLYDGDSLEVETDDKEVIGEFRKSLNEYRKEHESVGNLTFYSLLTTTEDSDGIRYFSETDVSFDENVAKEAFAEERTQNEYFKRNGSCEEKTGYGYAESNYVDGKGFTVLELKKTDISISKKQLRELLAGIDKELLREVLPKEFHKDPLMAFIEEEVPYRMEKEIGISLSEQIKKELIECVQNDVEIFIDFDKFDMNLKNMYHDIIMEEKYEVLLDNVMNLLEDQYSGHEEFGVWADRNILPTQLSKRGALYNAISVLKEQYEGNESFSTWVENEVGVSKDIMLEIGFSLENEIEKGTSLDEKLLNAVEHTLKNKNERSTHLRENIIENRE